jgi:N-acetylmuramoyl-L-alanine amidase
MPSHTVKQGDCISSIAHETGFFWETLWNHPDNAKLKQLRKNPNALLPGDVVSIPDQRVKQESCDLTETGKPDAGTQSALAKMYGG